MSGYTDITVLTARLQQAETFSSEEVAEAVRGILDGKFNNPDVIAFVTALHNTRGITSEDLVACTEVVRQNYMPFEPRPEMVDVSRLGFGSQTRYNILAAVPFIVAATGVPILKRALSKAHAEVPAREVVEKLGVNTQMTIYSSQACLYEVGIAFAFETQICPNFTTYGEITYDLKFPTILHLAYSMATNFGTQYQVVNTCDYELMEQMAQAMKTLEIKQAFLTNSESGAEAVEVQGQTRLFQVQKDVAKHRRIRPADFGIPDNDPRLLNVSSVDQSTNIILDVLKGLGGEHNAPPSRERAAYHAAILNSALPLLATGVVSSLQEGAQMAMDSVLSGDAMAKLEELRQFSHECT